MMRRSIFWLVNFIPVYMPALSPSMETGTVVQWKKKIGDFVNESDVFCTIQTDKAVVDYTNSFEPGYLGKIFCNNGQTMPVAKTIAVMVDEQKDVAEANSYVPEGEDVEETSSTTTTIAESQAATTSSGAPTVTTTASNSNTTTGNNKSSSSNTSSSQPPEGVNVIPVYMPALSPSMETGTVVQWKKKIGDFVNESDVFCTIQTDKAVVDYTNSFEPGYLAKIFCNNGQSGAVAKTIAVMVSEADEIAKLANYVPEDAVGAESVGSSQTHTEPMKETQPSQSPQQQQQQQQSNVTPIQHDEKLSALLESSGPGVMRIARYLPQSVIESIKPSGRNGRYTKSDFVGQPGFDYNDSAMTIASGGSSKLPSMSSSQPSSTSSDKDKTTSAKSTKDKPTTTITTKKTAGLAAATATSSASKDIYDVIIQAGPVIKSLNDTTLLKKLLNTMQKSTKAAH